LAVSNRVLAQAGLAPEPSADWVERATLVQNSGIYAWLTNLGGGVPAQPSALHEEWAPICL